jgi:hypothetical protein
MKKVYQFFVGGSNFLPVTDSFPDRRDFTRDPLKAGAGGLAGPPDAAAFGTCRERQALGSRVVVVAVV